MTAVLTAEGQGFELTVPVVIVGAGACGLTAAIAARDAGAEVNTSVSDWSATLPLTSSPASSTSGPPADTLPRAKPQVPTLPSTSPM